MEFRMFCTYVAFDAIQLINGYEEFIFSSVLNCNEVSIFSVDVHTCETDVFTDAVIDMHNKTPKRELVEGNFCFCFSERSLFFCFSKKMEIGEEKYPVFWINEAFVLRKVESVLYIFRKYRDFRECFFG